MKFTIAALLLVSSACWAVGGPGAGPHPSQTPPTTHPPKTVKSSVPPYGVSEHPDKIDRMHRPVPVSPPPKIAKLTKST